MACEWTHITRIHGSGTGLVEWSMRTNPPEFDLCENSAPLRCILTITGKDDVLDFIIADFVINDGPHLPFTAIAGEGFGVCLYHGDCLMAWRFTFPEDIESYAIGDIFFLEYQIS